MASDTRDKRHLFGVGIARDQDCSRPARLEHGLATRVPGDGLDGAARDEKGVAAVKGADDAERTQETTRRQEDSEAAEPGETHERFQPGAYRGALGCSDPRRDPGHLSSRVRVSGNRHHTRPLITSGCDAQQRRQGIARDQQDGRPCPGHPLVHLVGEPYGKPRVHQIREEYLPGRVGVGADDDPNDPKERDLHSATMPALERM